VKSALALVFALVFANIADAQDVQQPSVAAEIRAGRKALEDSKPDEARDHFSAALSYAAGNDRFVALIGLGRAELWLEDYSSAAQSFRDAQNLAAGPADRQAADVGLARALNALGYNRQAYALAAPYAHGDIEPAIEMLRSSQALGWDDLTTTLPKPAASPEDHLGNEYLRLQSETDYRLSNRVDGGFSYSHDSDDLTVFGFELGAWFPGAKGGSYFSNWRVAARTFTVEDNNTSDQLSYFGAGTHTRIGDDNQIDLRAGADTVRGWTFFEGNLDWEYSFSDRIGADASVDRAPILTTTALAARLLVTTYSLGTNLRLTDHIYAIPSYYHQDFSDGNHRDGWVQRLVLSPYDLPGTSTALGAQLYAKEFHSSFPSAGVYFNPANYDLVKLDLNAVHRFSPDWLLRATAGGGFQTINGASAGSYDFEVSLVGRLPGNGRLEATLGRSSFASAAGGGSEYWVNTATISISYPLSDIL
jgi:hypothetical protein